MREGSPGLVLGAPGALDHVIIHWEFIANCLKQAPAVSTKIRYNSSSRCAGSYLAREGKHRNAGRRSRERQKRDSEPT